MPASALSAIAVAGQDNVCQCAPIASQPAEKLAGHGRDVSPKKSLIWVLAISTAMPLVKPITTGRGMNLTAVPSPVTPSRIRTTPAISVHMNRPSRPCFATMPATTTTNAPVGPPIWVRDPPSAEIRNPATMAQ